MAVSGPGSVALRPAAPEDEPFLWEMLYRAAHMAEDGAASARTARGDPVLDRYVRDWGKATDLGSIAERTGGEPVGAAWLRLLTDDPSRPEYVDPATPELAIAVRPEWVGRGVGTRLLQHIIGAATGRHPAIVLSVRAENPARRLYERAGFVTTGTIRNRVGTASLKMLLRL